MPFRAALTLATLPVNTMSASALPSPVVKASPVVWERVRAPPVTPRVTRMSLPSPLASSVMLIRLPLPLEKTRGMSSSAVWAPGTLLTGASFREATEMVAVSLAVPKAVALPRVVAEDLPPAEPVVPSQA